METTVKVPEIAMIPVTSSQIASIGHHPETNTLAIKFPDNSRGPGGLYHYQNFTAEQFEAFKSAESVGSHFIRNIKKATEAHPYKRIS